MDSFGIQIVGMLEIKRKEVNFTPDVKIKEL